MDDSLGGQTIKFIIESRLDHLSLLAKAARGVCSSVIEDELTLYQIELCVVEAACNIITHSYQYKDGNYIEVDLKLNNQFLAFKFLDSGQKNTIPFTGEATFDPEDIINLPESGRGLPLIHKFMTEVILGEEDGKNVTLLTKKISQD